MNSDREPREHEAGGLYGEGHAAAETPSLADRIRSEPAYRTRYLRWRQRKASENAKNPAAPVPSTTGSPLPGNVRQRMEPQLGANLGDVRVHAGGESADAADQLGARAFTVGNDVHFGAGQFAPNTKEGDKLLAHELTHVVQGQKAGVQRKAERDDGAGGEHAPEHEHVSQPDEPAEKEADAVADHVGEALHGNGPEHAAAKATPTADHAAAKVARKHYSSFIGVNGKIHLKPRAASQPVLVGGGRKIFRKPNDPKQAAGEPGKRDIDKKPAAGASDADWVHYLGDLHRFLRDQTGAEKEQLLDIRANREAHPVVGAISEAAASVKARQSVKVPDDGIWDQVFAQLNKAHALFAGDKPDIDGAKREMATAVRMFEDAHKRVYEYRSRTEGGAETAAHTLRGVEIGCDITLTILSAGVGAGSANLLKLGARGAFKMIAEQAGKSLVKTGAKAAVVGGANKLADETAETGVGKAIGVDEFDVGKILADAGEAAAMNFLGVLVGGSLSKVFMRTLGEILGARMAPEALLALAEKYGVQGVVPPELFVSKGWRFLVGVAGDACTTTLLTGLSTLVEQLRSGGKRPTGEQFVAMVVQQMIQNGLLQILFSAMTHGKAIPNTNEHGAPADGAAGQAARTPEPGHAPPAEQAVGTAAHREPTPAAAGSGRDALMHQRMAELTEVRDPKKLQESRENDAAFKQRRIDNDKLHNDPARVGKDLETAGLSREKYETMKQGEQASGERIPLAFENREQFDQFKAELGALVDSLQVDGEPISATAKVIGTSVNFYSGNPKKPLGHHYDRLGPKTGDVDIELTSPELTRAMLEDPASQANEKVMVGGKKTIFKNELKGPQGQTLGGGFHSKFPAFKDLCAKWSKAIGREVDIKLRIDMTPASKIPKPSGGPIEILRKER